MSTCKALLSKIINKDAFYEQEDVTQNIFAFRVVGICILFYSFVMILNCLHIFIVEQTIFTRGYVAACVLALIYGLLLVKMGLEHPFTKYLSVTAIGLIVMVASASLTYHMIIIMMIPIIIASMYTSKRLSVYAFIFTVVVITISTYVGYYFGVCDANMALLTDDITGSSAEGWCVFAQQSKRKSYGYAGTLLCDAAIADGGCILLCK